jgi:hypothetical protein
MEGKMARIGARMEQLGTLATERSKRAGAHESVRVTSEFQWS